MKFGRVVPALAVAVVLAGAGFQLLADAVTLQPVADTCLFSLAPENNMGAEQRLILGGISDRNPGEKGRVLMKFDVSSIPVGATITAANLTLQVLKQNFSAVASRVELHRLLQAWVEGQEEGSNGSPAQDGESTWLDRVQGSASWAAPGGQPGVDFDADASSTVTFQNSDSYTWPSTAALVADVQAWLNQPAANFGWIALSRDEETRFTSRRVASRELEDLGPQLVVEYTTSPQIPPPNFSNVALTGGLIELRFHGEPGNLYTIFWAEAPAVGTNNVLTNIPVKLFPADAIVTDPTDQSLRFYRLAITGFID